MLHDYSIEELDTFDDQQLTKLDWRNLSRLNGRLLELHGEGVLGNENSAKLPLRPILCIDRIERIEEEAIDASFTFPEDVRILREKIGGMQGVDFGNCANMAPNLRIPIYDLATKIGDRSSETVTFVTATQHVDQNLWPLRYHFRGDPVTPGNFGTHGMIALLKETARDEFDLEIPVFRSLDSKKFSGMIFEDPKQIRFELRNITRNSQEHIVAAEANLYLEKRDGERIIQAPIYTFKNLTVVEHDGAKSG